MGIGVISLSTSQKREIPTPPGPPGPPFTSDSADNGLSVDTISGRIVLGNDVGDPANPAQLLSSREILMDDQIAAAFEILLRSTLLGVTTHLTGGEIRVESDFDGPQPKIFVGSLTNTDLLSTITNRVNDRGNATIEAIATNDGQSTIQCVASGVAGSQALLRVASGLNDDWQIIPGLPAGVISFRVRGLFQTMAVNTSTLCTLIQSNTGSAFNGATLQVSGTHTYRKFPQSQTGTLNLDRDTDSAKMLTNSGALTINFPNMVGANFREGFFIDVHVNNAAGITINAGVGITIRYGGLSTSVGGTVSSTEVGAYIRIMIIDSTTYVTAFSIGLWSLT